MNPNNEIILNRQFAKLNTAHRKRKGSKSDAVIYSVTSNETFDVASYNQARILRIYRGDIWFATNIALPKGRYVYLGFNMNESDPTFNSNKFHPVRIKGRTESQDSSHRYRYQASHINPKSSLRKVSHKPNFEKQGQKSINLHAEKDPRNHPRKSCHKSIFFYSQNTKCQGIITNLSRSGTYVETKNNLFFKQKIKIFVPVDHSGEGFRLFGMVVRVDQNGVGLKLTSILDTRSGRKPRISSSRMTPLSFRIPGTEHKKCM